MLKTTSKYYCNEKQLNVDVDVDVDVGSAGIKCRNFMDLTGNLAQLSCTL